MPFPQALLALGLVLVIVGVVLAMCTNSPQTMPLFGLGLCLVLGGVGLLITGLCNAMRKLQVAVPGHFLLHPRTGTRFSPHQALAIQRRLDRIRREMSEDSVSRRPEPEPSLPSTPLPWDMEPPPSYDTVMKSQEHTLQVMLVPQNEEEKRFEDSVYSSAEAKQRSSAEALPRFSGEEADSRLLNKALSSRCHSCPTLHLLAQPDQDLPAGDVPLDRRRAPYLLAQVPEELP
ncbi:uncharacterized protein si:dkeyp-51f12.3 [Lampris incognitus]|uniref:uncharacterized protein si:dkeyp-51f12.3 n=1 Tax=Lampris incognitus TaxID=2546036 RepID=UPI0024B56FB9|nr:uncharacterized protein si:dkeyp-51f12.3 [Lampris incognitus]XP_056132325.1 uncharacterized protein si:dkeyp-51f12.3 [Lampris incognitus]